MIIIDIWVASYFSLFRKYEQKGLYGTFIIFSYCWVFNIFSIFSCLVPYLFPPRTINFFVIVISLFIISGILTWKTTEVLKKRYFIKWDYFNSLSSKIPKIIGILIMIVHYAASIWYFCISLPNFEHLIER